MHNRGVQRPGGGMAGWDGARKGVRCPSKAARPGPAISAFNVQSFIRWSRAVCVSTALGGLHLSSRFDKQKKNTWLALTFLCIRPCERRIAPNFLLWEILRVDKRKLSPTVVVCVTIPLQDHYLPSTWYDPYNWHENNIRCRNNPSYHLKC